MSNFTPGPWDVGPDEFGNLMVYRVKNGQEIATIYPDGYENEEMRIGDEGKIWEGQYIRERLRKMPGD